MKKKISTVSGDGIGPDIVRSAKRVLTAAAEKFGHEFGFVEAPIGGGAYDAFGTPIPDESIRICKTSDAVLLGAVGGPKWDGLTGNLRPEAGLLKIRKELKLFANLRPAKLLPCLKDRSPLRADIAEQGFDLVFVRELTGGIYFGERGARLGANGREAYDTEVYSEVEIERILRVAFELAAKRSKKLTEIDKANVLESSRLWRKVLAEVAPDYPDVSVETMLVDNAAMQLAKNPAEFDVLVTSNMFGDILSDLSSALTGSIGLLPSASVNDGTLGLYEPVHGSAPDIAGKNIANPVGTVLSAAWMLRNSFDMQKESDAIENAVTKTLNSGYRTADLMSDGKILVGTDEMTDRIIENL